MKTSYNFEGTKLYLHECNEICNTGFMIDIESLTPDEHIQLVLHLAQLFNKRSDKADVRI